MHRRHFLGGLSCVFVFPLSGCSSSGDSSTSTDSPTPTPTPTPEPKPKITDVILIEISNPRGPNPLGFQIYYENLATDLDYRLGAIVDFDSDIATNSKQIRRVRGHYPGLDGFDVRPPEGTPTDSRFINYTVELLHDSEVIDEKEGGQSYE